MSRLLWATLATGACASVLVLSLWGIPYGIERSASWLTSQTEAAAVFFVPSITIGDITNDYHGAVPSPTAAPKQVKILIVPGHQPSQGGTDYGGVYERDIVVDIADALAQMLSQNPHYEVMVARTKEAWNPILIDYFSSHALEIDTFRQSQIAQMQEHLADGSILPQADQVYHLTAPSDATLQLYGINKWSSDNHYDIVLHLHINDYAGRGSVRPDSYTGFTVYVPNHQYSNAAASLAIGKSLARELNAYHATSTLPKENWGVLEDQQLIAIGSNNSADSAAALIEYGYIYEPQFQNSAVRQLATADYAYQTYLGLQDFFGDLTEHQGGSLAVSYSWQPQTFAPGDNGPAIYALQAALRTLGSYPAPPASFSACPISGIWGSCTKTALIRWQKKNGLPSSGVLTQETIISLHEALGTAPVTSPLTLR